MCGIFGWIGAPPLHPEEYFADGSALLYHRGPDDEGREWGEGWGLGFRRLSILDLSPSGHQPMASPDGRYRIIFNGEIYNFIELRQELMARGDRFMSGSDTEVLLHLIAAEWTGALKRLNGMFAFAVVDIQARRFFIARDRLGVKPLYYTFGSGRLCFASETKCLLGQTAERPSVAPDAIVEFLGLGYLSSETCIFEGFQKLPPGHYLAGTFDAPTEATTQRHWSLYLNGKIAGREERENELWEELEDLLKDATRLRLRSDVPVGIFLSGGIDSGLIATLAARVAAGNPPLALTVGFDEADYDETTEAKAVANQAGLRHEIIRMQPVSLALIDRLAWYFDEPFGDSSALPTFALCEAASMYATVFLAGDGGDEAFGGYRRYFEASRYGWLRRTPGVVGAALRRASAWLPTHSQLRLRLLKSGLADSGFAAAFDGIPDDPPLMNALTPSLRAHAHAAGQPLWSRWRASAGQPLLVRQQLLDYELYLPDDILVKVDRASMAHSIELRSPFLDYRVVEWAARLPRNSLLDAGVGKLPLRALGNRLLPPTASQAAKRGFGVPITQWFRAKTGQKFLRDRLLSSEALNRGWWTERGVESLIVRHERGEGRDFSTLLWRFAFLDAWARWYVDTSNFRRPPQSRLSRVAR